MVISDKRLAELIEMIRPIAEKYRQDEKWGGADLV